MHEVLRAICLVFAIVWQAAICNAQGLRPSLINIAQGKKIVATSTCGEGIGAGRDEVFCRLATVPDRSSGTPISGLACGKCDPQDEIYSHPIQYAIDGSERWWQSPPLSRGMKYQNVNITIDLGQEYQVAYVIIKTGNAPRPGVWALERSADGGKTFQPWQYFATSASECLRYFDVTPLLKPVQDDTVICSIEYSQVPPFENGEIHISLVNDRPGASNFALSKELQEWTLATHVRLRLLKVKTLLADLLPLAREDPTVTRRYFYSIKDISIGGICMCNGHADACIYSEENSQFVCRCKHNTCGAKCSKCCPGFVQKKWRPGNGKYECEACNCHGHATECYYDERVDEAKRSLDQNGNYEGGGVCVDCQHNTIGINCQRCKAGYYRPTGVPKTSKDACRQCNCDKRFSTGLCYDGEGQCECLPSFAGALCNTCSKGFYDFPNCKPCDCHPLGTAGGVCGPTAGDQCPCKPNYTGAKCDKCAPGHHSFPQCKPCACDKDGSIGQNCDPDSGKCQCDRRYTGLRCDQCGRGFYDFPQCRACNCDSEGTAVDICDPRDGRCVCMPNFGGPRCDICNEGFHRFPYCLACNCSGEGSISPNCNQYGGCTCTDNYDGRKCDYCRLGYYDYPRCIKCTCDLRGANHEFCDHNGGQCSCKGSYKGLQCNLCQTGSYGFPNCQECQCNPSGTKAVAGMPSGDCSFSNTGQCDCKDNVQGLHCTECKQGSYNLQKSNPLGCEACNCNSDGVIGGLVICNDRGQCPCKMYVTGRECDRCKTGYFGLQGFKIFGCSGCNCDIGGSYDQDCDDVTGQCTCRVNVQGRSCDRPSPLHFSPSLLHVKAEIEDGSAISGKASSLDEFPVRFGFDESIFPGFSWRGYAVISDLQQSIKVSLGIPKAGPYFLLIRYVLDQQEPAVGEVTLTSKDGRGNKQSSALQFTPTKVPNVLTVGGAVQPVQFMLTPGTWEIRLDMKPANLLLDFVSALPRDYSEANILNKKVTTPCRVNGNGEHCNQFSFPSLSRPDFVVVEMETGYFYNRQHQRHDSQVFDDPVVLKQLDFNAMALLNKRQTRVTEMIVFRKTGQYVLVIQYYRPTKRTERLRVFLRSSSGYQEGAFYLNDCQYRFGCRQLAVDKSGKARVFDVKRLARMAITLLSNTDTPVAIDSITAIPLEQWNLDYIVPSILCATKDNKCIPSSYPTPKDAVKVDVNDDDADSSPLPPNIVDPTVKLTYLQGGRTYEIAGSVPKPGRYAIVLHYYQPSHVTFEARASVVSDRARPGSVKFMYCPHTSGCRAVLQNNTDSTAGVLFYMARSSVALQINLPPNTSAWLDYALFVHEDLFSQLLAEAEPVSLTSDFLEQCSQNNFQINASAPQFCKASAFSITTNFLQTTLPCDCDPDGSLSDACAQFGGQCLCRDHVIGRNCSRCRSGYYGFPDCKKCGCLFCNEVSGACDCPPKTVGSRCELCLIGTYGHDPIIGCRDCACDQNGVVGGDISCDARTGQCQCRPSHRGRRCDECSAGYYRYPLCEKCSCDSQGVTSDVCDHQTGKCFCKAGVTGDRCDKCAPGYFNLDAQNPDGCTKCWCSGLSSTCTSGDFYRSSEVSVMDGWLVENTQAQVTKSGPSTLTVVIGGERIEKTKPIYWIAPRDYLQKKIYSYGGKLTYSIRYAQPKDEASAVFTRKPDVIIKGVNGLAIQYKKQLQEAPGATFFVRVQFTESLWETTNGSNITRDDFMSILLNIESLRLRASYSTRVADVSINDIKMESAVEGPLTGAQAVASVEICDCPAKANGSSCELCGAGYTRAQDNTTCVPCECSGHSTDCHPDTGLCHNCSHNAAGDMCEFCQRGYYDTDLSPASSNCSMCACPLGISSNNFATECALGADGMLGCVCKDGYSGPRCGKCADGFYGNPSEPGDYCKRCGCNGNIDPNVKGSCDSLTGKCLKCINGTTGDQCDRCIDGYYGDAAVHQNCSKCRCDACGAETTMCNGTSGICACKPNVVGETCDRCKPNSWGFEGCLGCKDCACAEASLGSSCDVSSGQCSCAAGVAGRQCDRCRAGFWEYTGAGCKACNCPSGAENLYGFCDVNTGQCCKPGGNCTICPRSYRLTPEGCEYCGDCVDRLLVTATELNENITRVLKPLQSDVSGILVQTSLDEVNGTLQRLIPVTNKYNITMNTVKEQVGTASGNYTPSIKLPKAWAVFPLNQSVKGKDVGPNSYTAAQLGYVMPASGPHGQPGGSYELVGDYIEIPNGGNLDTKRSTSILLWVYHEGQTGPILHYLDDERSVPRTLRLWLNKEQRFSVHFQDRNKEAALSQELTTDVVAPTTWYHVAAVYDYQTGMASLWLNGTLTVELNIGQKELATDSKAVRMGYLSGVDDVFFGRVSCVQFYDVALTQDQISALMTRCQEAISGGDVASPVSLTDRTGITETAIDELKTSVMATEDTAMYTSGIAANTSDEALKLEEEITRATNITGDLIKFVKRVAEALQQGKANQSSLIQEAEEILKELRVRDFYPANVSVSDERELVQLALDQATSKLNETLELWNQARAANRTLQQLQGRFGQILDKSVMVMERAMEAAIINSASSGYDSETPMRAALQINAVLNATLEHVKEMLGTTKDSLNSSSVSFQNFKGNFAILDDLIRQVNEKLANLSQAYTELEPVVKMADGSASRLRSQADDLDKLLTDTEQFAGKAVNASRRYSDITRALNDSLEIASEAVLIASEAQNKSMDLSNEAEISKNESNALKEDAVRVESSVVTLENNFTELRGRVQSIQQEITQTTGELKHMHSTLSEMEDFSDIENRTVSLQKAAVESFTTAEDARKDAEEIERNLPELSPLKDAYAEVNDSLSEVENDLDEIVTNSTEIRKRIEVMRQFHKEAGALDAEVQERIDDIQNMMSQSYTLLDSMSLVMKFGAGSSAIRSPPPTVPDNSRVTNLLFYAKPQSDEGLLTYLGNVKDRKYKKRLMKDSSRLPSQPRRIKKQTQKRRKRQNSCQKDYAAVFLQDKKVHFAMCMSGVFVEVNSSVAVRNATWAKIQAQILPFVAILKVSYEKEATTEDRKPFSVFNPVLKIGQTGKLVVGGLPPDKRLSTSLPTSEFRGCIDGLEMNGYSAGLWNAEFLQNPSHCTPFEGFIVDVKRYHLYGSGYLQVYIREVTDEMLKWQFDFKTPFSNGLLMVGIDKNPAPGKTLFYAIEMIHGKIVYSYNVGLGIEKISSAKFYDDAKNYLIEMKKNGVKTVKFTLTITKSQSGEIEELVKDRVYAESGNITDAKYVYFGGIRNRTLLRQVNITSRFYRGCIGNIKIASNREQTPDAFSAGYKKGCVEQIARAATFLEADSFLEWGPELYNSRKSLNIGLAFRTTKATGLLLYEVNDKEQDFLALGLLNGKVVLQANGGTDTVTLETYKSTYNDDKWHFVTAHLEMTKNRVQLFVDSESLSTSFASGRTMVQTTSPLYVGGVPSNKWGSDKGKNVELMLASSIHGSVKDFTIDERLQNFAENVKNRRSVDFGDVEARQRTDVGDFIIKKSTPAPSTTPPLVTSAPPTNETEYISTDSTLSTPLGRTDSTLITSEPNSTSVISEPTDASTHMSSNPTDASTRMSSNPTDASTPVTVELSTLSTLMASEPTRDSITEPSNASTEPAIMTSEPFNTSTPTQGPQCIKPGLLPRDPSVKTFGADVYSYTQYNIRGSRPLGKLIGSKTRIQLEFRTHGASGIILYVADPSEKQLDFVACYLEEGLVMCGFSCGGGVVTLRSTETYNDGLWHTLRFNRRDKNGTLYVDEVKVDVEEATGSPRNIDNLKTLYVGGVPENFNTRRTPKNMRSFPGCIRNFTVNKAWPGEPKLQSKTVGCFSEELGSGVSFLDGGGYIVVQEEYSVGRNKEIALEIKPTSNTALLLSVASPKGDYLALEMMNGSVYFRFDNGDGGVVVTREFLPAELCDGQWHKITARKEGHEAWLQVDDGETGYAAGKTSTTNTDVLNKLYVGGLPDGEKQKGVTVRDGFMGCMRNLVDDDKSKYLSAPLLATGNIYRGGCVYNIWP